MAQEKKSPITLYHRLRQILVLTQTTSALKEDLFIFLCVKTAVASSLNPNLNLFGLTFYSLLSEQTTI